jgi:hypothetical protein
MPIHRSSSIPQQPALPQVNVGLPASIEDTAATSVSEAVASSRASDSLRGAGDINSFEVMPSACFTNTLIGLDRNADGVINAEEFATGRVILQHLTSKPERANSADQRLFNALCQASEIPDGAVASYQIRDGKLELSIPQLRENPVRSVFRHQLADHGGLPTELMGEVAGATGSKIRVGHGTDPGNFYCEHTFFGSQLEAAHPESSVLNNRSGEKLVGFLHIPSDPYTNSAATTGYTQESRHAGTRQVIGAAIRGYCDEITAQNAEQPVRILLTGYDTFHSVRNNPTGDFVSHRENIDASMRDAFGPNLLTPTGQEVFAANNTNPAYRYQVRDQATGEERELLLFTARLPVDDSSINPQSPSSVQQLMRDSSAQAVISMGVASWPEYRAEHHADSGGLDRSGDNVYHRTAAAETVQLRDNYSLARAIFHGGQIMQNSAPHIQTLNHRE